MSGTPSVTTFVELYEARLSTALERIPGARPGTKRGDAVLAASVQLVEELIGTLVRSLEDEHSALRRELRAQKTSVRALEKQLDASTRLMLESQRSKNHRFLRAALAGLGAFALAVSGGATQGWVSSTVDGRHPPSSFAEVAGICEAMDHAIANVQERSEREDRDEEPMDALADDPWASTQDSEGHSYVFTVDDADSWRSAFTPVEADEWAAMSFTPEAAEEWRRLGFSPSLARGWRQERFALEDAADWNYEGFEPEVASDWRERGFEANAAARWRRYDLAPDESRDWRSHGFDVPSEASE